MTTHRYNVDLTWTANRKGLLSSTEVTEVPFNGIPIEVATPPQFPAGMPGIWSPEHLFTAAVSSCFMTTFLAIAENSKLAFTDFSCAAEGKLEMIDGLLMMSEVALSPVVTITDELQRERANKVLDKTFKNCLISNSIKSKVTMSSRVEVSEVLPV